MAIIYVAAESFELDPFAASLQSLRKLKWPIQYAVDGVHNGQRVVLVANGAGPKLAARAVETAFRAITGTGLTSSAIQAVVSTGFCGALQKQLSVNDIVLGTTVVDEAGEQIASCLVPLSNLTAVSGVILSQNRIASTASDKSKLSLRGALAVEMESAGVAACVQRVGVPLACVKVVSDAAEESFPFDLNQMRTTEGRIARGKIGIYALQHPVLLPKLWKLKRRSDEAARALGEFLVSCTIPTESATAAGE